MLFVYYVIALPVILAQQTFLELDELGADRLAKILVQNLHGKDFSLDFNYVSSFYIGELGFHGVSIFDVSSNPDQIKIKFEEATNSVYADLHLESISIQSEVHLKMFGIRLMKNNVTFRITNSKFRFSLVLDEADAAVKISVLDKKFHKFKIGHVKIISWTNIFMKIVSIITSEILNTVIWALDGTIAKAIVTQIDSYGSQIPSQFEIMNIALSFPLARKPLIQQKALIVDLLCGSDYIPHQAQNATNYVNVALGEGCANYVMHQAYQEPNIFQVSAIAQLLSDIMEIDTHTMQALFPPFRSLPTSYDVQFDLTTNSLGTPRATLYDGYAKVKFPVCAQINLIEKRRLRKMRESIKVIIVEEDHGIPYTSFNGTLDLNFDVMRTRGGVAGNLNGLQIEDLVVAEEEKMSLYEWNHDSNVALQFGRSYANQVLYTKKLNPATYLEGMTAENLEVQIMEQRIDLRLQF